MSSEVPQTSNDRPNGDSAAQAASADGAKRPEAMVLVKGEAVHDRAPKPEPNAPADTKDKSPDPPDPPVSQAKVQMQRSLPTLTDEADVGVTKEHLVTRDGKADLAFSGSLLACAAPAAAPQGRWREYRIYLTSAGKHVFSKATRTIFADQTDAYEAEVFDPAPASVPTKLLRGARDLTHSSPMTWVDAAVKFFGYDPLAKALYRKLSGQFEEHIA